MTSKAQEWDDRKAEQLRDAAYASIRGKCFVLTGRMWDFRQNIEGRIQAVGGRTDSRVSFGVDYLVQADGEQGRRTTKVLTAERCGTTVITETQLKRALQGTATIQ